MVTFSCLIELIGIMEGLMGDLSKKMDNDLRREESKKDASLQGLTGGRRRPDKGEEGGPSKCPWYSSFFLEYQWHFINVMLKIELWTILYN